MPAISALHSGGIVAFPTETFYGLAVDPRSALAVRRVFALKQRAADQPLPLIADGLEQIADHVGTMTPLAERLASRGWPGPLTLIIPASPRLCDDVHLSTGTRGRACAWRSGGARARPERRTRHHVYQRKCLRRSASRDTGARRASFAAGIDVLIDAGATPAGLPSTIVDATGNTPCSCGRGSFVERVLEFSQ